MDSVFFLVTSETLSHEDAVTAANRDRDAFGMPRSRRPDALDK